MANEVQTLHVHFGINHFIKKQCGLCDKYFDNYKHLEDHLSACDMFVCSKSGCKDSFEKLADMKEHIEHKQNSPAHYQFSYWILNAKDKTENEIFKKYITIYPQDW